MKTNMLKIWHSISISNAHKASSSGNKLITTIGTDYGSLREPKCAVTHSKLSLKLVLSRYLVRVLAFISKVFTIFHLLSIELVCKGETHQHRNFLNLKSIQPLLAGLSVDFPVDMIIIIINR